MSETTKTIDATNETADAKIAPKPATTPLMVPITSYETAVQAIGQELPIVTAESTKNLLNALSTFFTTRIETGKSKDSFKDDHTRDARVRDAATRSRGSFARRNIPNTDTGPKDAGERKYL